MRGSLNYSVVFHLWTASKLLWTTAILFFRKPRAHYAWQLVNSLRTDKTTMMIAGSKFRGVGRATSSPPSPSIPMAPQGLSGKQGEGGLQASVLAGGENFLVKVEIDKICFRGVFCEGPPNYWYEQNPDQFCTKPTLRLRCPPFQTARKSGKHLLRTLGKRSFGKVTSSLYQKVSWNVTFSCWWTWWVKQMKVDLELDLGTLWRKRCWTIAIIIVLYLCLMYSAIHPTVLCSHDSSIKLLNRYQ